MKREGQRTGRMGVGGESSGTSGLSARPTCSSHWAYHAVGRANHSSPERTRVEMPQRSATLAPLNLNQNMRVCWATFRRVVTYLLAGGLGVQKARWPFLGQPRRHRPCSVFRNAQRIFLVLFVTRGTLRPQGKNNAGGYLGLSFGDVHPFLLLCSLPCPLSKLLINFCQNLSLSNTTRALGARGVL